MKNKLICLLFIALCFIFIGGGSVKAKEAKNDRIYYINSADMYRLYSMNTNGTGIKKLTDRIVTRAWEYGDYIYFTVAQENSLPKSYYERECGIFRTKKDSTGETNIYNQLEKDYNDDEEYVPPYKHSDIISKELFISDKYVGFWGEDWGNEYFYIYDSNMTADEEYPSYHTIEKAIIGDLTVHSISDRYVYLYDDKGCYRIDLDDSSETLTKIKNLPKLRQKELITKSTDSYCEKHLMWKKIENAESYTVSRFDKSSGKYIKLAETKDTKITLNVLTGDLTADYRVTAAVNGKRKEAKLTKYVCDEKFIGDVSSMDHYLWDLCTVEEKDIYNGEYGIYRYDKKKASEGELLYKIKAHSLFIDNNTIYVVGYSDDIQILTLDSKTKKTDGAEPKPFITGKMINNKIIKDVIFTDKSIYVICEENVEDIAWGDSIYRFDREDMSSDCIVKGEMYAPEYFMNVVFADDRLIFNYDNGRIASINRQGERKIIAKADDYDYFDYHQQIYNGKLYFNDKGLCCVCPDGSGYERLSDADIKGRFIIYCDKIFYTRMDEGTSTTSLYRSDLDGSEEILIAEKVGYFEIIDASLWYREYGTKQIRRIVLEFDNAPDTL